MASELHIAISAEKLFSLGSLDVSNTLFTSFFVATSLTAFLFVASRTFKQTNTPSRFQAFFELVVESLYDLVESVTGKTAQAAAFTPLISGFLIFILLTNWFEQLPGVHTIQFTGEPTIHLVNVPNIAPAAVFASEPAEKQEAITVSEDLHEEDLVAESEEHLDEEEGHGAVALLRGPNADINMTLALALISVGATQYFGISFLGLAYFKKFFNFSSPIAFFIGILELIAEFSKIISFAFRLFGNIFAGEVLISVIKFLVPVLVPIPFIGFELFVGGLQAYVFAMLSLVFFNMATQSHEHDH